MPKLTLWKDKPTLNYKYVDNIVKQIFNISGVTVYIHKYLGPKNTEEGGPSYPDWNGSSLKSKNDLSQSTLHKDFTKVEVDEFKIQDLFYLENRNRKYEQHIYEIKAYYQLSDINFELRQFGLFSNIDKLDISFHYNDMYEKLGRELMSGDIIEVINLRDNLLDNKNKPFMVNKFYVVEDGYRPSEGFDPFWLPHIFKITGTAIANQQEFYDVLNKEFLDLNQNRTGFSIGEIMSEENKELEITDFIDREAQREVPKRKFFHNNLYILPCLDENGNKIDPKLTDETIVLAYGDGIPDNGYPLLGQGFSFPENAQIGDFFLRLDYTPNTLFQKKEKGWIRREFNWRTPWSPANDTLKRFINNNEKITHTPTKKKIPKRQYISKVLKPDIE